MPLSSPSAPLPRKRRHDRFVATCATLAAAFVFGGEVMGALGYW